MADDLWNGILSSGEIHAHERLGYWRTSREPGMAPALRLVDLENNFTDAVAVAECVFDRAALPHRVNLFDMAAKYAAVWSLDETLAWLEAFRSEEGPRRLEARTVRERRG